MLILMITLTLTSMLATRPVYAQTAPTATVNPSQVVYDTTNGTIGTLFNVTVTAANVLDMVAWQVKMSYNSSMINVTRWYEPKWDSTYVFDGSGTLPVPAPPKVQYKVESGDTVSAGVGTSLFPLPDPGGGFNGGGLLCIFTVNITAHPPPGQTYRCDFNINYPNATFYLNSSKPENPDKHAFTPYNGQYWFIPELAPLMILGTLAVATIVGVRARKHIRKT
jgi:hypothetical protein